jgi:hypothetical protein
MPCRSQLQPGRTVGLRLVRTERKLLLEELGFLEEHLVQRIQETPPLQAVPFTWRELKRLTAYVAGEWVLAQHNAARLGRLYHKISAILNEHGRKRFSLAGAAMGSGPTGGIRLTQGERESLIRGSFLPPAVKRRLAEVPPGTQFLLFTQRELTHMRRSLEKVTPRAVSPHKRRLQAVVQKIMDVTLAAGKPPEDAWATTDGSP